MSGAFLLASLAGAEADPIAIVTTAGANRVVEVDIASRRLGASTAIGGSVRDAAFSRVTGFVLTTAREPDAIASIDPRFTRLASSLEIAEPGGSADAVAVLPDGSALVAILHDPMRCGGAGALAIIDPVLEAVSRVVCVGVRPTDVAVAPDGTFAYVVNSARQARCAGQGSVSVIDAASFAVTETVCTEAAPVAVAFDPTGAGLAYVANQGAGTLTVIDTATHTAIDAIEIGPPAPATRLSAIAVLPDGDRALVTDVATSSLAIVDLAARSVAETIDVARPVDVALDETGTYAYVPSFLESTLDVVSLDERRIVAAIPVGDFPLAVALGDDRSVPSPTPRPPTPTPTRPPTPELTFAPTVTPKACAVDEDCDSGAICQDTTCRTTCAGDCLDFGEVTLGNIARAVRVATGNEPTSTCPSADVDRNGAVAIDEIGIALANFLDGSCPPDGETPRHILQSEAIVEIGSARAGAAGSATFEVRWRGDDRVIGTQIEIAFGPAAPIVSCNLAPHFGDFRFLPPGCRVGVDCESVLLFALDLAPPRPSSEPYQCTVDVSSSPPGTYALRAVAALATDDAGNALLVATIDGAVRIPGFTPGPSTTPLPTPTFTPPSCRDDADCDPGRLCDLSRCVRGNCPLTGLLCPENIPCPEYAFGARLIACYASIGSCRGLPPTHGCRAVVGACTGDCDGDGRVSVDELARGVAFNADGGSPEGCRALDPSRDGRVTADEVLEAVENASLGCTLPLR